MESKELGFGILGLGMGLSRARETVKTPGAKLLCVCDIREDIARKAAEELHCQWTTSYTEMLERKEIEVIGVYTPSGMHCDHAIKAMEAGKHVFIAKPMDIRVEKCDEAINIAKRMGVVLAVDFQMRYDDLNRRIKEALNAGKLGRLLLADLRMKWWRDQSYYDGGFPKGWRSLKGTEGGSAANQGVHFLDLLLWWLGPVRTVYGMSGTLAHGIETEDISMALLTFRNGAWGSIITTTFSYPSLGSRIELTGDRGTIVWNDGKLGLYKLKDEESPSLEEFEIPKDAPKNIIEDMILAVSKGAKPAVDGEGGRWSVELFNAIYESSRTGRVIELN
ncbi:MAG: Gfo/Idh/MocA family oxidoreductase [Candidatus Bathyarchaeia archaeon]